MAMIYCWGCGKEVHESATACPSCGAVQKKASGKSRYMAALLAFLFGGIGFHKFYLGKKWQGFFYLVFCWTMIPVLFSLFDMLCYLLASDESFEAKYC